MQKTKKNKLIKKKRIFTKKNYLSGDGMLTTIWGPSLWHYLHTISFNYPNQPSKIQKQKYKELILNLKYTLPCRHCRENLIKNLKNKPLTKEDLKSRETFSRFIYELHERINRQLGKKSGLSYCDVRERYEHFRARCTKKHKRFNFTKKEKGHKGCTEALYGKKAKCIMKIVPNNIKCKTLTIDKDCKKKRIKL